MLERRIQAQILRYLNSQPGVFVFKSITNNYKGIPDLIICYQGHFIYVEVKRDEKQKLSPTQVIITNKIHQSGGVGFLAFSLENFIFQWNNLIETLNK